MQCLERARAALYGPSPPQHRGRPPTGGCWDVIGHAEIARIERRILGLTNQRLQPLTVSEHSTNVRARSPSHGAQSGAHLLPPGKENSAKGERRHISTPSDASKRAAPAAAVISAAAKRISTAEAPPPQAKPLPWDPQGALSSHGGGQSGQPLCQLAGQKRTQLKAGFLRGRRSARGAGRGGRGATNTEGAEPDVPSLSEVN
jgi:hypothetical protein